MLLVDISPSHFVTSHGIIRNYLGLNYNGAY